MWIANARPTDAWEQVSGPRRARVVLGADLELRGQVTETYVGQTAFAYRATYRNRSADEIRQAWQEGLRRSIPGAQVHDWSSPDLQAVGESLNVSFSFVAPGAARRGKDLVLVQPDCLTSGAGECFSAPERKRDIGVRYRYRSSTEVEMTLPEGWVFQDLPSPRSLENEFGTVSRSCRVEDGLLHLNRTEEIRQVTCPPEKYRLAQEWGREACASDRELVGILAR